MSKYQKYLNEGVTFVKECIAIYSVAYVFTTYGVGGTKCIGPSMLPTFREDGEIVLFDSFHLNVLNEPLKVGDVIISVCPYDPGKNICKRVAAVEGDVLPGRPLRYGKEEDTIIPPGYCYLLGDNARNSLDSRSYGAVPTALIKGKVLCKLTLQYPFIHPIEGFTHPVEVEEVREDNQVGLTEQQINDLMSMFQVLELPAGSTVPSVPVTGTSNSPDPSNNRNNHPNDISPSSSSAAAVDYWESERTRMVSEIMSKIKKEE